MTPCTPEPRAQVCGGSAEGPHRGHLAGLLIPKLKGESFRLFEMMAFSLFLC